MTHTSRYKSMSKRGEGSQESRRKPLPESVQSHSAEGHAWWRDWNEKFFINSYHGPHVGRFVFIVSLVGFSIFKPEDADFWVTVFPEKFG